MPGSPEATQLAFQVQPSTTTSGQPIAPPVQVSIRDASGNPVDTATNQVSVVLSGNSFGGTLGGTVTVDAVGGVATFADLQVSKPGTGYTLHAVADGLAGAMSEPFDASPIHGLATTIAPVAGDGQTATVGKAIAISPAVKVTDAFGDPVAQSAVTFVVASGGGTAAGLEQTTDAGGVATVGQWTLGTVAGENTLSATSADLPGSPVTFTETAVADAAVTLILSGGDDQIASLNTPVVEPPSVFVSDVYGNPVADVGVTFAVTAGGGSITGASQVTDAGGVASVGSWTVGGSVGTNTLKATSAGLSGSPVTFHAHATILPAAAVVEVHNDYFLSVRNGSGANPTMFGSLAVDTIGVGGTVTWNWAGQGHNVTPYTNPAFAATSTHSAPFTFGPVPFDMPGTYYYRCTNHSQFVVYFELVGMRGVIVVR
jgi:adhesin/invasin